ncbi:MAG TPA: phosphatase RsbU N-terminal domain-containing protein [Vicinamibacterales bacterium]|nr:phosphatase RsbU N-terminal domain-containing protein [Vicinamibacterales bacterium]
MSAHKALFARRYRAALLDYLLGSDETGLVRAYDLGRLALEGGLGPLEILRTHQRAAQAILASTQSADLTRKRVAAAGEFLMETLSPFEMTYRGYVALIEARHHGLGESHSRRRVNRKK